MALKDLQIYVDGFKRFQNSWFKTDRKSKKVFGHQSPKVLIIACSDSRVDPALMFDCDPGDFFVVRNVANLVPEYGRGGSVHGLSAALEYAVKILQVEDIIVMGHSHCGGIAALMNDSEDGTEFLAPWLNIVNPALLRVHVMEHENEDAKTRACEREAILVSLGNLLTFPWLRERLDVGSVTLHGWYFDLSNGSLERWSAKDKSFQPLVQSNKAEKQTV